MFCSFSFITLPDREGGIGTEESMTEDLGEEDIVGDVVGFELVAEDGAVGAAEVALVSRVGQGSRRRRKRTWGAGGRPEKRWPTAHGC